MTNIGHFRAAGKLLERQARHSGQAVDGAADQDGRPPADRRRPLRRLGTAGARMEMPGCSLCMGNQAQVKEGATVMSTSTRNFPNRLGKNTFVYLGSAELAAICSKLGRIPTKAEYLADVGVLNCGQRQCLQVHEL